MASTTSQRKKQFGTRCIERSWKSKRDDDAKDREVLIREEENLGAIRGGVR